MYICVILWWNKLQKEKKHPPNKRSLHGGKQKSKYASLQMKDIHRRSKSLSGLNHPHVTSPSLRRQTSAPINSRFINERMGMKRRSPGSSQRDIIRRKGRSMSAPRRSLHHSVRRQTSAPMYTRVNDRSNRYRLPTQYRHPKKEFRTFNHNRYSSRSWNDFERGRDSNKGRRPENYKSSVYTSDSDSAE